MPDQARHPRHGVVSPTRRDRAVDRYGPVGRLPATYAPICTVRRGSPIDVMGARSGRPGTALRGAATCRYVRVFGDMPDAVSKRENRRSVALATAPAGSGGLLSRVAATDR